MLNLRPFLPGQPFKLLNLKLLCTSYRQPHLHESGICIHCFNFFYCNLDSCLWRWVTSVGQSLDYEFLGFSWTFQGSSMSSCQYGAMCLLQITSSVCQNASCSMSKPTASTWETLWAENTPFDCRYSCAYSTIKKRDWWDITVCGGPIVEQATHFVDLLRYFGGDIVQNSIKAVAVGPDYVLSDMPEDPNAEHTVCPKLILGSVHCILSSETLQRYW